MTFDLNAMGDLVRQAQEIQKKVSETQAQLAEKTVSVTVGGGMVTAVASGAGILADLKLEKEIINPGEADMLRDLVLAAANEALKRAQDMVAEEMASITSGLKLPGRP